MGEWEKGKMGMGRVGEGRNGDGESGRRKKWGWGEWVKWRKIN